MLYSEQSNRVELILGGHFRQCQPGTLYLGMVLLTLSLIEIVMVSFELNLSMFIISDITQQAT